ncbi:hypothetical protein BLA13014_00996 [Burkholderia aenigmatica]|uniref:DUF4303 domain-containing protein n=1 Tax=Burkholderia aenigmatica TaxID=2015348 RepID=A0A6P2IAW2_9BURK|nr:DUF4303 domain-containing protein [Burkholderia aenigmatica]VWB26961.1 hypothetical protein BLA13014_00996 [Burkholderia aenigmatica]
MNTQDLIAHIAQATATVFSALRNEHPDEDFYAFALYTDSSAMSVQAAGNSEQALEEVLKNAEDRSPESDAYSRWASSEWAYEAFRGVGFKEISKALRESPDRSNFSKFKADAHAAMIEALRTADASGVFGTGTDREKIIIFVTITDDNDAEQLENDSAKQLNSPAAYQKFLNRYDVAGS